MKYQKLITVLTTVGIFASAPLFAADHTKQDRQDRISRSGQTNSDQTTNGFSADKKVAYKNLPASAQAMIKDRADGDKVQGVHEANWQGTVYQASFKNKAGEQQELLVSEDGNLLNQSSGETLKDANQIALRNTGKVTLDQVPPAVRRTINNHAKTNPVEDIDKGEWSGKVYRVALKHGDKDRNIRVAVINPNTITESSGASTNTESTKMMPLSATSKVTLDQVPEPAKKVIKSHAGSANVEDIDKGTLNGKTVYQAGFKKAGQHTELQVTEDGTVIKEASGADLSNQ